MASANRDTSARARGVHRSLEHSVLLLTLIAGVPAGLALLAFTWGQDYTFEVRWTLTTVVLVVWVGAAALAYQMVTRALYLQANLLGALREGDYSIRGTGAKPGSAVDLVMHEINALGDTLQRQRTEAVESTALLPERDGRDRRRGLRLRHGRDAGAREPRGRAAARAAGGAAARTPRPGAAPRALPRRETRRACSTARSARRAAALELRRSTFRRDGKPHQLLVFADLTARCARKNSRPGSASSACSRTRSTTR